ncbi:hypothetical protein OAP94_00365 [bacterium]|nr:hypothetical protein [bacterium]MDC1007115.1 hypothetical protein [bacterium]
MNKTFTVTYADEPYKTTVADGNTFECTYTGPRYILGQVDRDDDQVREAGRADTAGDDALDATGYEPDEYDYIVLDAAESDDMALRCAFMTDEYTHPDVDDYSETITTADGTEYTWTHVYEGTTGMLAHIYVGDSLLYNHETTTWTNPTLRTHNNTRESTLGSWVLQAAGIRRAISSDGDAINNLTSAEKTTLANHATWLESIAVQYAGIDHWKVNYPEAVLPTYEDPNDNL